MFTGNRGCLVDESREVVRHHRGSLWITCVTSYRGWKSPLEEPRHWTPLFFLDDAVALAAGHRPCGLCRRDDYRSYRDSIRHGLGQRERVSAADLNRRLAAERLQRGRGLSRAADRKLWRESIERLPTGTVIVENEIPLLVTADKLFRFGFDGWDEAVHRPGNGQVTVLTPPTSVLAMMHGHKPTLHESAL
jgi:hypothetical protein